MQAFLGQGHEIFLLTQAPEGEYHKACSQLGVKVSTAFFEKGNPAIFFLKHAWRLLVFCRKHRIDVVYAHLETASLPAVLIQYFIPAKVFACRHVIDEAYLLKSRNFILLNKIVYRLARNIIVVSQHCKDFMISKEDVKASKIQVIFLAYNFDLYPSPVIEEVEKIRSTYSSKLLLMTACRLVAPKRPELSVQIIKNLVTKGYDVKLMLLGAGPEAQNLQSLISRYQLDDYVFLCGHKSNIMDYITACDMLIHPSILDSSSVIIKEAGLRKKAVITCSGIGDVDEYIVNAQNGFLVSVDYTTEEATEVLSRICLSEVSVSGVGEQLNKDVLKRFDISGILPQYDKIHAKILDKLK